MLSQPFCSQKTLGYLSHFVLKEHWPVKKSFPLLFVSGSAGLVSGLSIKCFQATKLNFTFVQK